MARGVNSSPGMKLLTVVALASLASLGALAPMGLTACSSTPSPVAAGPDAAVDSAPPGKDAAPDVAPPDASDSGSVCSNGPAPLPATLSCPALDADAGAPATWADARTQCDADQGEVFETACGGYLAYAHVRGVDGETLSLYDATTKKLVAALTAANDQFWTCVGSVGGVGIDTTECWKPGSIGGCVYTSGTPTRCGADAGGNDSGPTDAAADADAH